MVIHHPQARRRIVKGWAFMDLTEDETFRVQEFLEEGDTEVLPSKFQQTDWEASWIWYGLRL